MVLPHKYSRQQMFILAERHKHGEQNMPPEVGNKYSRSCTEVAPLSLLHKDGPLTSSTVSTSYQLVFYNHLENNSKDGCL